MPVNRSHAFANGPVFGRPGRLKSSVYKLLRCWSVRAQLRSDAARAWRQFAAGATISPQVLFGPNAWCFNGKHDPRRITLSGRVVCRGVLRIETFGDGQLVIGPEVYIGDDCIISCANTIEIGEHTLIAHGVQIFDNTTHPLDWQQRTADWHAIGDPDGRGKPSIKSAPITIGAHAWIGLNAMIHKGVTVGDKSVVAAGSVVTKDVPPCSLVAGNPATVIKTWEK